MLRKPFSAISGLILALSFACGFVQSVQAVNADQTTNKVTCTAEQGQALIDEGRFKDAIRIFSCVIDDQPTEIEGYRGRMEAALMLGSFSDAVGDFSRLTAYALPLHPDAEDIIMDGYAARLALASDDIVALTGASFTRWCFFHYPKAIHLVNQLLEVDPDGLYGNLFRGSSRLLQGVNVKEGKADLERAIGFAPESAGVHFIVADAYTYGPFDPQRAFYEASLALQLGLDTPRIHAILASSYIAFGDLLSAADHIQTHIDYVTSELLPTPSLAAWESLDLYFVPGRTYEIPIPIVSGQAVSILTASPSHDIWDSIMVLLDEDGTPVIGNDDFSGYLAGFEDWVAAETGTYHMRVTTFESVSTGQLVVSRD